MKRIRTKHSKPPVRLLSSSQLKSPKALLFALAFILIGTIIVLSSRAAGPFASLDAGSGNSLTGAASSVNDGTAFGGTAVRFGTPTPTPGGGNQSTNCVTTPSACGFPDSTTSGITAGAILTKVPSQATSGPGWKYYNGDVYICGTSFTSGSSYPACTSGTNSNTVGSATTGLELADGVGVTVVTSNVTITNLKITGVHGQDSVGVMVCGQTGGQSGCRTATNNVTIRNCELIGAAVSDPRLTTKAMWAGFIIQNGASSTVIDRCSIHGTAGPIGYQNLKGTNAVTNSYLWDNHCPAYNGDCITHINGIYVGGNNQGTTNAFLVQNNTILSDYPNGEHTSGVIGLYSDSGSDDVTNIRALFDHNIMGTSNHNIFTGGGGNTAPSYMWISNNHWLNTVPGSTPGSGDGIIYGTPPWPGAPFTGANNNLSCGNVWDDGQRAGAGADASNGYPSSMVARTTCPASPTWLPGLPIN